MQGPPPVGRHEFLEAKIRGNRKGRKGQLIRKWFPDIHEEEAIHRFLSELLFRMSRNALPTCTHLNNIESLWEIWLGTNDGFQFDFMNGYSCNALSMDLKTGMELRFLLLLCISGFQAQFFDAMESRVEGQSLVVKCRYRKLFYRRTEKAWCLLRDEKCSPLVNTSYTSSHGYQTKVTSGRATIEDDTRNGIVTITMEKLQVQDSGVYWCARYYLPYILYPLRTVKLDIFKATSTSDVPVNSSTGHTHLITPADSSSLNSRSTFLWLGVGFLINKTLLAVMIALPVRRRNCLGGSTQTPINLEFMAQFYDAMESRVEGQRLVVECRYRSSDYSATQKTWCQLRDEKCSPLVSTSYTSLRRYQTEVTSERATIQDHTRKGIVTITMEKLKVQDSGVYLCALYYTPNKWYRLKTIKLDVSRVQEYDVIEGQNLSVQCPYNTQDYKEEKKAWCRSTLQNECDVLVNTDHWYLSYQNSAQNGRARIHDDTQKGIVTITMEKLQVDDAGVYWCARYEPPRLYRIIEVKLAVAKATTTSVVPVTSSIGHTSLILNTASAGVNPADSSPLSGRTFIILGVVLGVLFILALIGLWILCNRKSRQLKTRGDGQAEAIYEEPKDTTVSQGFGNMNDPKDNKQEMPQDLKYATLAFKSRPSPRESVYANIMPNQALETPRTRSPTEPVEYASISLKPLASGAKS
ncbi:transmembrane protein 17 [Platysternon megacephalum]|uniref:Transmembrane protein 17 n=1 Tax=Platysternon megacephalum TaxID=55544 RepID=A0A4D9EAP0_9SAUR|nr:transmembrane protein 17 [Platysternon megacephalum]